jgi:anti-anti-sigma factor
MQLVSEDKGGVTLVRVLEPKLTYPLLGPFLAEVQRLVASGVRSLAVDLSAVVYLDSAAIGCLMDVHRLLREAKGVVRLFGLQPRVRTMISMTGVLRLIEAHDDEGQALQAFGGGRGEGG